MLAVSPKRQTRNFINLTDLTQLDIPRRYPALLLAFRIIHKNYRQLVTDCRINLEFRIGHRFPSRKRASRRGIGAELFLRAVIHRRAGSPVASPSIVSRSFITHYKNDYIAFANHILTFPLDIASSAINVLYHAAIYLIGTDQVRFITAVSAPFSDPVRDLPIPVVRLIRLFPVGGYVYYS